MRQAGCGTNTGQFCLHNKHVGPWQVWLSWLEHLSITKRLQVQFPVRAHTQVVGLSPSWHMCKEATNRCFSFTWMFLSLPSCLSESNEKNKVLR